MTTITTELAQRIAAIAGLKAGYKIGHADVSILQDVARELERQLIAPLPIGELIQRLSDQTGEGWGAKYLHEMEARIEQQPVARGITERITI